MKIDAVRVQPEMNDEQPVKRRGRPAGAKDLKPRKVLRKAKPREKLAQGFDPAAEAGNGRDEAAYEPTPLEEAVRQSGKTLDLNLDEPAEAVEPAAARLHVQGTEGMWAAERQPVPPPKIVLPDLFIHRVENGYIVRPAYSQGDHRTSTDARTWVVTTKTQLAGLVLDLIADPIAHTTPQRQSQDYYSPPLIVEAGAG